MPQAGLIAIMLAGCSGQRVDSAADRSAPSWALGEFTDDYGGRYRITRDTWIQLPDARYHIVRWDTAGHYLIAQVVPASPDSSGTWARIDWVQLRDMAPYTWAFCYSAWAAPSAATAESVSVAKPETPTTGCNGYPYSRMQPAH
jgi:hypothetical protein